MADTTRAWLYVRGDQSLRIVTMGGSCTVYGPGDLFRQHTLRRCGRGHARAIQPGARARARRLVARTDDHRTAVWRGPAAVGTNRPATRIAPRGSARHRNRLAPCSSSSTPPRCGSRTRRHTLQAPLLGITARGDRPRVQDAIAVERVDHVVQVHGRIDVGRPQPDAVADCDRGVWRQRNGGVLVVE